MRYASDRPSIYTVVGDRIRMIRLRDRISQRDLGQRLGISHASVSDLERGKSKPDLDNLAVIAEALGAALSDIVTLAPRPPASLVDGSENAK